MTNTGPVSENGKAISSRNAISHGVLAKISVVPGLEREEDWEAHRAGVLASLAPEGHLENVLAERVALQLWRLQRVARYEASAITTAQESVEEDVARERRFRRLGGASPEARLERATEERERRRDTMETLNQFLDMRDEDPVGGPDPDIILSAVEAVSRLATRQNVPVPFIPKGQTIGSYSGWTAGKLRWLLTVMATAEGRELAELLALARQKAIIEFGLVRGDVEDLTALAEQERSEAAVQVAREQKRRIIPSEPEREKVARYEAHLSRELYKAMHELEALQERRHGRPSPLARIDIEGEIPKLRNELPA
jgi:hypothetical protein